MPTSNFTSYRITSLTHFQSTCFFFTLQSVIQTCSTVRRYSNSQKHHQKKNLKYVIHFRRVYNIMLHLKHVSKITRVLWFNRQHHKAIFSHPIACRLLISTLLVRAGCQADLQTSVNRFKALWSFNKIYTYSVSFRLEYLPIWWQWIR